MKGVLMTRSEAFSARLQRWDQIVEIIDSMFHLVQNGDKNVSEYSTLQESTMYNLFHQMRERWSYTDTTGEKTYYAFGKVLRHVTQDMPEIHGIVEHLTSLQYSLATMNLSADDERQVRYQYLANMVLVWSHEHQGLHAAVKALYDMAEQYTPHELQLDFEDTLVLGLSSLTMQRWLFYTIFVALHQAIEETVDMSVPWSWQEPMVASEFIASLQNMNSKEVLEVTTYLMQREQKTY